MVTPSKGGAFKCRPLAATMDGEAALGRAGKKGARSVHRQSSGVGSRFGYTTKERVPITSCMASPRTTVSLPLLVNHISLGSLHRIRHMTGAGSLQSEGWLMLNNVASLSQPGHRSPVTEEEGTARRTPQVYLTTHLSQWLLFRCGQITNGGGETTDKLDVRRLGALSTLGGPGAEDSQIQPATSNLRRDEVRPVNGLQKQAQGSCHVWTYSYFAGRERQADRRRNLNASMSLLLPLGAVQRIAGPRPCVAVCKPSGGILLFGSDQVLETRTSGLGIDAEVDTHEREGQARRLTFQNHDGVDPRHRFPPRANDAARSAGRHPQDFLAEDDALEKALNGAPLLFTHVVVKVLVREQLLRDGLAHGGVFARCLGLTIARRIRVRLRLRRTACGGRPWSRYR